MRNVQVTEECAAGGSPRRCGGQGDVLAGALATLLHWAATSPHRDQDPGPGPELLAAWGAARLTRGCAEVRTLAAAGPRLNTTVYCRLRTRSTAAARPPRTWWRWCTRSSADCTRVRPSCDPQPATTSDITADPSRWKSWIVNGVFISSGTEFIQIDGQWFTLFLWSVMVTMQLL